MRWFVAAVLCVAVASAGGHHGHGRHFAGHKHLRHSSHSAKDEVEVLNQELETVPTVVKDGELKQHRGKSIAQANAVNKKLRTKVQQMSSKIKQLEHQLLVARARPPPPPFARFFHKFDPHRRFGPHHPPPPHRSFQRFESWRHHGHRRHRFWHGVLCVGILTLLFYGIVRLCKRCCCNDDNAANAYPAYVVSGSPARGGVVHNPYVSVSSAAVVPTAEGHAVPTGSTVPMAFAPASAPEQLQHGVVIGTPVSF